jgi:alpha-beta hydrolase superfamily lysophospholipase
MAEYLRAYELPLPPLARYGQARVTQQDRVAIHAQAWVPGHALATVLLVHGYSEHSANFARLIRELVMAQFAVITFDLRGHGLSEGPTGHVASQDLYAEDAESVLREIFPNVLPNCPLFLWGHSLGAMIALQLMLRAKLPVTPAGAVLTSPLLGLPPLVGVQKILAALSPTLSKLLPAFPIAHGIPPTNLSHDESYLARRHDDPLMRKVATPRWLEATKLSFAALQASAADFQKLAPTLLMLAGEERVTNLLESRRFAFRAFPGQRNKVLEFPGMYHELEKEPEVRARVVSESLAWFKSHL